MAMEALNAKVLWTGPLRHLFASSVPRRSSCFLFLRCCSTSPAAAAIVTVPPSSRGRGRGSPDQSSTSDRDSIRAIRLRKVEDLRGKGLELYAYKWERTHCAIPMQHIYKDLANGEEVSNEKDRVSIDGRIVTSRAFGKLAFLTLQDDSGTIQELGAWAGASICNVKLPRWKNLIMVARRPLMSSLNTSFHSTAAMSEKWKNKWSNESKCQQPSKSYIRYTTRQKRADTKKALKDLLFNSGASRYSFEDDDPFKKFEEVEADQSSGCEKKGRPKSARRAKKDYNKKMKHKMRENFRDDFDEKVFQARFGNRCYSWSFDSSYMHAFENWSSGFQWKEDSMGGSRRTKRWETLSDVESDDELSSIGSTSDRVMLGLPATGALKLEDVKNAFRLMALRWHPDKHQGPSQSIAEEKFKLCVNAYKSLCNAFSAD